MEDNFERDAEELTAMLLAMGEKIPDKAIKIAARRGAENVLQSVKLCAPVRSGELRNGIITKPEKTRIRGKVVYDVIMDPGKNSIFQKWIINRVRSTRKRAYYPASQEYGFFTRRPGGGLVYKKSWTLKSKRTNVPGKRYMRAGAILSELYATETIIKTLEKEIDKICR